MAEILPIAKGSDFTNYGWIASFNVSLVFLFEFDANDSLTNVLSGTIFYD